MSIPHTTMPTLTFLRIKKNFPEQTNMKFINATITLSMWGAEKEEADNSPKNRRLCTHTLCLPRVRTHTRTQHENPFLTTN